MIRSIKRYNVLIVLLVLQLCATAQNNSSPYSIIGIGDLEDSYFNRTSGMANTGIAYRSAYYLIHNNPASYSALQDQFFLVEAAGRGRFTSYYGNNLSSSSATQSRDFSVNRFSFGIKVNKWWGSSAGVMPFSSSNYAFSGKKNIQGTNVLTYADYEGTGGVNKVYWDNGFRIGKHFSVGISTSYLFGSLTQKETLAGTDVTEAITTTNNIFLRNLYMGYGAQFFSKINSKWDLSLGATYSSKTSLAAQYSSEVATASAVVHSDITKDDYFKLPDAIGGGFALTRKKTLTIAGDYRYQSWASLQHRGLGYTLEDSKRASLGIEFSKMRQVWPIAVEKVFYQAGVFYSDSYLKIYNQQLKDMGFSLGVGFNSKRSTLGYLLAFEYGVRGTREKNLVQERYGKVTFTLSYKDFWYTKGIKYY